MRVPAKFGSREFNPLQVRPPSTDFQSPAELPTTITSGSAGENAIDACQGPMIGPRPSPVRLIQVRPPSGER
jgi:hypothetical protein